jgi:hypothetical protein
MPTDELIISLFWYPFRPPYRHAKCGRDWGLTIQPC